MQRGFSERERLGRRAGRSSNGPISNAYATGAVSAPIGPLVSGLDQVGGLVGSASNSSSITNAYATGAVSAGPNGSIGGLVGSKLPRRSCLELAYWDTLTTGQTTSAGGTGLTTAQLQGALPSGFAAPWATGPGLYPFLSTFFPGGVQAVSGFAYSSPGNPARFRRRRRQYGLGCGQRHDFRGRDHGRQRILLCLRARGFAAPSGAQLRRLYPGQCP